MLKTFRQSRTGRTLHYFFYVIKKHKLTAFLNIVCDPLGLLFGDILVGYYVGKLLQGFVQYKVGSDAHNLYHLGYVILTFFILQIIVYRINDYAAAWRQARNLRDLEQFIFSKLPNHSYSFFSETYGGALVSQVTRFLHAFEEFTDEFFFDYNETFSRIALAVGFLLFIARPLGILLAIWAPLFVILLVFLSAKKSRITRTASEADSKVIAYLADTITNMVTVKTFARSKQEIKGFKSVSKDRFKKRYRSFIFSAHIRDTRWAFVLIFYITYIFMSIHFVVNGQITPAALIAGQIYVTAIVSNLLGLHRVIQRTEQLFADAAELTDVLDAPPSLVDPANPEEPRINKGEIKFNDVSFNYPDDNKQVLNHLNLTIPAGQKVGLVGHSGSGKSTITRLLLRFLDIQDGVITIDGQDISKITQDDLRQNIAFVPQEPLLFHRTIKENIGYGKVDPTDEDIKNVAKLAYADEFISQLPKQYETYVGERGVKLSGGEKQRVAIARAMLSDCPILVLDEATSALDSKSEKYISKALDDLMSDRTTIVVAHRLSTIKKLDRILLIRDGKIIEDGNHEQLLKLNGEYAELWNHQSGNFLDS